MSMTSLTVSVTSFIWSSVLCVESLFFQVLPSSCLPSPFSSRPQRIRLTCEHCALDVCALSQNFSLPPSLLSLSVCLSRLGLFRAPRLLLSREPVSCLWLSRLLVVEEGSAACVVWSCRLLPTGCRCRELHTDRRRSEGVVPTSLHDI